MTAVAEPPILPGQRWRAETGKHAGQEVEVIKTNQHSVFARVLPSPGARSWNKGKSGQVWTLGRNLFGTLYRFVRESGGGSVHDAPLPPAARRSGMTIEDAVTQAIEEHQPAEVVSNGIAEYDKLRAVPYEKICSSCGKAKVAEDYFYHSSASKDGFHTWCKVCQDANRKKNYLKKKGDHPEVDRVAAVKGAMSTDAVKAKVREGARKKVEALSAEQKGEIIALWQSKTNPQEVQKAYGLNGAMYRMVLDEYRANLAAETAALSTEPLVIEPEVHAPANKFYTVTYTVMRPVEVTEVVEASYMTEAIRVVGARDGVQEVTSVVLNKSEGK